MLEVVTVAKRSTSDEREKTPAMWLWVDRFFGSARVQQLGGLSQAVYLVLLAREWQLQGQGLPADREKLRRLVALEDADWAPIWSELEQFFEARKGRLYNRVLEEELEASQAIRGARSEAGKRGAQTRWQGHVVANGKDCDLPMAKTCPPSPSPSPSPSEEVDKEYRGYTLAGKPAGECGPREPCAASFEAFWDAYPANRSGRKPGKQLARETWARDIPAAERQQVIEAARQYAALEGPRGYVKHPERFLKDGFWRDWLGPGEQRPQALMRPQNVEALRAFLEGDNHAEP